MRAERANLSPEIYVLLLRHLQLRLTTVKLHSYLSLAPSADSRVLFPQAFFFDFVVVNHRRYLAHYNTATIASSLIALKCSNSVGGRVWVGELLFIFAVDQDAIGPHRFGYVRWLKPTAVDLSGTVWGQL
jgi:hypothetical protein